MHLSYCTNVHPAEDLAGIVEQLDTYATAMFILAGLLVIVAGLVGIASGLPSRMR